MNRSEPWWSTGRQSLVLDGAQLIKDWESELLNLAGHLPTDSNRHRALQSLSDLTKRLWDTFNNNRENIDRDYMSNEKMLLAYLAAFFIPNIERTRAISTSTRMREKLSTFLNQESLEILDFGSGPLSCSFGILLALDEIAEDLGRHHFKIKKIRIVAVERSEKAVKIGQKWLEKNLASSLSIVIEQRTSAPKDQTFDIILAANVFNEIPVKHHLKTFTQLENSLKKDDINGLLLIIEPGQTMHSKNLIDLRDGVLEKSEFQNLKIIAPCPHLSNCPLSAKTGRTDWCWFRAVFQPPPFQLELDNRTQLDHGQLAYSFLAFSREVAHIEEKVWSVCVSDEMDGGLIENSAKRAEYFEKNSVGTTKINREKITALAKSGLKTKLCSNLGTLLGGIRTERESSERFRRGDIVSNEQDFELLIYEK